jgi:hypothetical protein
MPRYSSWLQGFLHYTSNWPVRILAGSAFWAILEPPKVVGQELNSCPTDKRLIRQCWPDVHLVDRR